MFLSALSRVCQFNSNKIIENNASAVNAVVSVTFSSTEYHASGWMSERNREKTTGLR